MNESIKAVWTNPWLTKKRKIMLAALLVFATCSSVYKFSAGGSYDDGAATTSRGPYVRAGGVVCDDMTSAMQMLMQERAGVNLAVNGCAQLSFNSNVNVRIHRRVNGVVEVSNAKGTVWVSENDVVE